MSDPVTNAEVEDVLSSIRRLVSEDKRPVQAPKTEARSDRLVLTPSLRVTDDAPEQAAPEAADQKIHTPDTDAASLDEPSEASAEIAIDSLLTDDTAIDVYEDDHRDWNADEVSDLAQEDADETDTGVETAENADHATDYSSDPYGFDNDEDLDGETDDDLILSTVQTNTTFEPAQDTPEDSDGEPSFTTERAMNDAQAADGPATADREVEKNVQVGTAEDTANEAKAASLTAKITALETAIGQIADTWEPDEAGEGDYAGTEPETMEWEDDQPEKSEAPLARDDTMTAAARQPSPPVFQPHEEPSEHQHDETSDTSAAAADEGVRLDEDEQLIDEEALRDLVSDIVRAELQGALGERITRNVRKLVRREIHRALTAQDLE